MFDFENKVYYEDNQNASYFIIDMIKVTNGTTYTLKGAKRAVLLDEDGNVISTKNLSFSSNQITINDANAKYIRVFFASSSDPEKITMSPAAPTDAA